MPILKCLIFLNIRFLARARTQTHTQCLHTQGCISHILKHYQKYKNFIDYSIIKSKHLCKI